MYFLNSTMPISELVVQPVKTPENVRKTSKNVTVESNFIFDFLGYARFGARWRLDSIRVHNMIYCSLYLKTFSGNWKQNSVTINGDINNEVIF